MSAHHSRRRSDRKIRHQVPTPPLGGQTKDHLAVRPLGWARLCRPGTLKRRCDSFCPGALTASGALPSVRRRILFADSGGRIVARERDQQASERRILREEPEPTGGSSI